MIQDHVKNVHLSISWMVVSVKVLFDLILVFEHCPGEQVTAIGNDGRGYCMIVNDGNPGNYIPAVYNSKPFAYVLSCP